MSEDRQGALVRELTLGLRAQVLPLLGARAGRAQMTAAANAGGDVTFAIDEIAERYLEEFIAKEAPGYAFYSEDRGLVEPAGSAEWVLVVDPIDGTRPALAGLESACISVALAPFADRVTMGEVTIGCIAEIKSGTLFTATRSRGLEIRTVDGEQLPVSLSDNTDLSCLFWTFGFRGRPAKEMIQVIGELVDLSSVGGAGFDLGSACFNMTRIATGQLDAYLDIGTQMIDRVPAVRASFERVGKGAILNNSPYDLAAAVLCLQEAGAVVTDADGQPLDDKPLLGGGHDFQMSCIAAANPQLHDRLLKKMAEGIDSLGASFD